MAGFKVGDRVAVVTRQPSAEDVKSGMYFEYFGGLTGAVHTVFSDDSICIEVDLESLTKAARERHLAMQESERLRWLNGLSGEARSRLTPEQQKLKISYKILVSPKDLQPNKGGKPSGAPKPIAASDDEKASEGDTKSAEKKSQSGEVQALADAEDPPPQRISEADLAAKEEAFLRSLQKST